MGNRGGQRWRKFVVWLHVVSSVGWMGQAAAMCALLFTGLFTDDAQVRESAVTMARVLDVVLLASLANVAAFTGFMLSATTPWGYFRHWWVLAKFALTIGQLYAGIFVLSGALDAAAEAAADGARPPVALAVGTGLMAAGLGFQVWLSVAKPWGRVPARANRPKPSAADARWFALCLPAAAGDIALCVVTGSPSPLCCLLVLIAALVARTRRPRVTVPAG